MSNLPGCILVTGTNGGLGSAIVKHIISSPEFSKYHGIYTVRSTDNPSPALDSALRQAKSRDHTYDKVGLDLSKLGNVREIAATINRRVSEGSLPRIRALILNAGFQEQTAQSFTEDGFDMSFQANYLSHWLLTVLLLQSMDIEHGRIVVVGSSGHDPHDARNDILGLFEEEEYKDKMLFHDTDGLAQGTWSSSKDKPKASAGLRRYCAGKLCEVMMIYELQKRLGMDPALSRICVLGLDPGGMATSLYRRGGPLLTFATALFRPIVSVVSSLSSNSSVRTPSRSAHDVLRAAFDTQTLGMHPGAAYLNGTQQWESSAEAKDAAKGKMLWEDSVRYTKLEAGQTMLAAWR